jgi:hypothetical protein
MSSIPAALRLLNNTITDPISGCSIWQGGHSTQGRYPYAMADDGSIRAAHRIVYEFYHGPVPVTPPPDGSDRYEVHHLCTNRNCLRPDHLELATRRQHAREHAEIRAAQAMQVAA